MTHPDRTRQAREIVEYYSKGDWTALRSLLAPNATYNEIGTQRHFQGADPILQALQEWKRAMTDSSGTVKSAFGAENRVVLELEWQGTHNGPFAGPAGTLPASGKRQRTPAVMVVTYQGDKVQQINHYFDMVTFLTQIGAMPALARA
jgi:steroid delta-isomerase-like uncharacterized protein